jgi:hypothetical protein
MVMGYYWANNEIKSKSKTKRKRKRQYEIRGE